VPKDPETTMNMTLAHRGVWPALWAALLCATSSAALAQGATSTIELPGVTVTGIAEPSLTVSTTDAATREIRRTPGAVEVVPDTVWRDGASTTLKDMLDYSPGVFVQPKWGEDSRLSIRGSGLSRNFHMRGIQLFQDGMPMNAADGSADFQELDPTAFRYAEIYKGANALRYGANALGGAVNLVTPSGHDASPFEGRADVGSFGFRRLQAAGGGAEGRVDGRLTASLLTQDGFRDHSGGRSGRAAANAGWRIADGVETRFYVNAADIRQDIPGSVTKQSALTDPRKAAAGNLVQDYQRNIESFRIANKTAVQLGETAVEFGGFARRKHLIHPIFQYLDYTYNDFGAFARVDDEHHLFGRENKVTAGFNLFSGWVDNRQYVNSGGRKGRLLSASEDRSMNLVGYAENGFGITPDLTLVTGVQLVHASRERKDEFADAVDTSGKKDYNFVNPKLGLIWQVDPNWQVFGNVSRSGEAPTFGELNFANVSLADTKAQYADTFEIGTRGERHDVTWDLAVYRAHLKNEFQFFDLGGGNYSVTNADKTIHQGFEVAIGWTPIKGIFTGGGDPDRLSIKTAYTFSDFRFDGDSQWGDNELPGAPRHFVRAELLYHSPLGFFAGPNLEWVPEAYYVDNANSQATKSYALLGFRAGFEFSESLTLFVEARNLTDEKYIASAGVAAVATSSSTLHEPGTGRSVYAGMRLRW